MDMIGKIRRLSRRGKKSEREISHLTGRVAEHGREVAARRGRRRPEVPARRSAERTQRLPRDAHPGLEGRCPSPHARARRTARALFVEFKSVGYDGGVTPVTAFVRAWRQGEGQAGLVNAFVPLAFGLGEAFQFDWSEEGWVVGVYYRLQVSPMKLCASRAFWRVAYPMPVSREAVRCAPTQLHGAGRHAFTTT